MSVYLCGDNSAHKSRVSYQGELGCMEGERSRWSCRGCVCEWPCPPCPSGRGGCGNTSASRVLHWALCPTRTVSACAKGQMPSINPRFCSSWSLERARAYVHPKRAVWSQRGNYHTPHRIVRRFMTRCFVINFIRSQVCKATGQGAPSQDGNGSQQMQRGGTPWDRSEPEAGA